MNEPEIKNSSLNSNFVVQPNLHHHDFISHKIKLPSRSEMPTPLEWSDTDIKEMEEILQSWPKPFKKHDEVPDTETKQHHPNSTSKHSANDHTNTSRRHNKFKRQPDLLRAILQRNMKAQISTAQGEETMQTSHADSDSPCGAKQAEKC